MASNQSKDLRIEVISEEREVRITIRITEFCIFYIGDEKNTLVDRSKGYYNNQGENVLKQ